VKKFFSNKWVCIALIFVVFVIIFFASGFKIVYAPWLLNDWEAIGACAGWAGVIASAVAIYFAIQIPEKIAEQQNKIALFEKRLEFYNVIINCISFSDIIQNSSSSHVEICVFFINAFAEKRKKVSLIPQTIDYTLAEKEAMLQYYYSVSPILNQGVFLFDNEISIYTEELRKNLEMLISCDGKHEKFSEYFVNFSRSANGVRDNALSQMKSVLKLSD